MTLLEARDIHFNYNNPNHDSTFSLTGINFKIDAGEFLTILGPNGSGKSTLLKILAGLLTPQKGSLHLNQKDYKNLSVKNLARKIAFVPQSTISIFPFSVYEIVMMGRTPYLNFMGFENTNDRDIVNESLDIVGVSHLKNKGINEISGGEAQRAYIARALAQKPELILLDEPNAHLDIHHQISVFNLLKELNEEHELTVIAVSHDLNLSGYYSQRAFLMQNGKILHDDDKTIILTENNIRKVFGVNSTVSYNKSLNALNVLINPQNIIE